MHIRNTGTVMVMEWRESRKLQTPHESRFSSSFCEGNIVATQQLCNFIFDHKTDRLVADRADKPMRHEAYEQPMRRRLLAD